MRERGGGGGEAETMITVGMQWKHSVIMYLLFNANK